MNRRALTLIELLVTIAAVAVLIALVAPALASAREQARALACGARLAQLGVALGLYFNDFDATMPQAREPDAPHALNAHLFGGKRGTMPLGGVDRVGVELRPLNGYVDTPAATEREIAEAFRSPADRGAAETYLGIQGFEAVESFYDLAGSSYAINAHSLDGQGAATLVPAGGGRMPHVTDPSFTWAIASQPIYNFMLDSDRGMRWYTPTLTEANILFLDLHTRIRVRIPDVMCEIENTTDDYTFLPAPAKRGRENY